MKVLIDLHHEDLFYSLQLLFEKRLGMQVYRPIGLDWYHEGYWHIYPSINTANQYLSTDGVPPLSANGVPVTEEHGSGAWINKDTQEVASGFYHVPDKQHVRPLDHRGCTLAAFRETRFDLVVASIPKHIEPFKRLIRNYQPHAKFIFQAGNNWGGLPVENLLTSSKKTSCADGGNSVFYHQEFDLQAFQPGACKNPKSVLNLQHLAPSTKILEKVEKIMPSDWTFTYHGAGMKHGPAESKEIPNIIRNHGFVWHVKPNEGYGYNIHHTFACGRPMLVNHKANIGMTAADLYTPQTVIDVSSKGVSQIAEQLLVAADNHEAYCEAVTKQFTQVVNFDEEEKEIRKFMERLI